MKWKEKHKVRKKKENEQPPKHPCISLSYLLSLISFSLPFSLQQVQLRKIKKEKKPGASGLHLYVCVLPGHWSSTKYAWTYAKRRKKLRRKAAPIPISVSFFQLRSSTILSTTSLPPLHLHLYITTATINNPPLITLFLHSPVAKHIKTYIHPLTLSACFCFHLVYSTSL